MKMDRRTERGLVVFVVCLLIGALFIQKGCMQEIQDGLVKDISSYTDTVHTLKGLNNTLIAYNETLELQNEKQLKDILAKYDTIAHELEKFKVIESVTIVRDCTVIIHDSIPYPVDKIIPCEFEPFQVRRDSVHYQFVGTIGNDFFSIDTIVIPDEEGIIIGTRKVGFMKGSEGLFNNKERIAEITHSNPLIKTHGIENYAVSNKKKWHETRVANFAFGGVTGALVMLKTLTK